MYVCMYVCMYMSQQHHLKGPKWRAIADLLPGRTDNAIKNRWNSSLVRLLQRQESAAQSRLALAGTEQSAAEATTRTAEAITTTARLEDSSANTNTTQDQHVRELFLQCCSAIFFDVFLHASRLRNPGPRLENQTAMKVCE